MAKLTTEEFIKKAREVHGDKYDYSKVEYVKSKTKVTIICPKHGEFLQTPQKHLSGQGCPNCGLRKFSNSRIIWTKEKCLEVAQKCHSQSELKEKYTSAYQAASRKGWLKEYTWFEVLWEPKWDRDTCYNEAKKYDSRGGFKKGCPYGYSSARKHGWLDDYTWFNPVREQKPVGYWTYERCFEEAKKCKSLKDFTEKANGAKQYASKMGWIKDYTWFEKPFRWTLELCEQEARKYTSKQDFYNISRTAYAAAVKYGWLDRFTWLDCIKVPNGYWTKARCEEEAHKYYSKKEFLKGCPAAHAAAAKRGWLDDFIWLVDQRIDIVKGKIDSVYVYVFEETKTAYVGRTLIRRQNKRDKEHIFNQESDSVALYAKNHNIPVPPMIILESNLTLKEGLEREDYWRQWYEQQGYVMLNKGATGIGKGSLGGISHGKWNRSSCYNEAMKYKSSSEFEDGNASAYAAARRNGWIKDYIWFDVLWELKWDKDTCCQEAKKYRSRGEFQKGSPGAYVKSLNKGWIEEYTWLHHRKTKPAGYWDNYENCYEEAKKYKTRSAFQKKCQGAYSKALKNGWLDDYVWFEERPKNNYWNRETCLEEAKKYSSKKEFKENASGAYQFAYKEGWLDDYTWLKPLTGYWTYETCYEEAKKYTKRSYFKEGSRGAYTKARVNGWLGDYIWFDEKPRMNYWNQETCYDEAKKYQSITEFHKGSVGAYQKALKEGWLIEYTWMKQHIRSWSYETCKTEASKYETRSQFKDAIPGAYHKSREKGWLDEFFPVSLRRKLDYDTCKQLTSRYKNTRDLYRGDRSLYKTIKEKGWLADFFPNDQ